MSEDKMTATEVRHANRSVDKAKMRAEVSHGIVADRLHAFVHRWAPNDPHDRDEFQMDLMRLFADCMRHQGNTLDYGIERFASITFKLVVEK